MILKSNRKRKNFNEISELDEFKSELFRVNSQLKNFENQFNMTDNEDLLEALIYEHKALESRYSYLMKKARSMEIEINFFERY